MNRYRTVRVGFPARVCGIPCRIEATIFPGCPPGRYDPGDPGGVELMVFDRRGRRARWLERKLDPSETQRLKTEALEEDAALRNPY